jgi:hypothetical protein
MNMVDNQINNDYDNNRYYEEKIMNYMHFIVSEADTVIMLSQKNDNISKHRLSYLITILDDIDAFISEVQAVQLQYYTLLVNMVAYLCVTVTSIEHANQEVYKSTYEKLNECIDVAKNIINTIHNL